MNLERSSEETTPITNLEFTNLVSPNSPIHKYVEPWMVYATQNGVEQELFLGAINSLTRDIIWTLKPRENTDFLVSSDREFYNTHWDYSIRALGYLINDKLSPEQRFEKAKIDFKNAAFATQSDNPIKNNSFSQARGLAYHWLASDQNLPDFVSTINIHGYQIVSDDLYEMKSRLEIESIDQLLKTKEQLSTPKLKQIEDQNVAQIRASYEQKFEELNRQQKALEDERTQAVAEIQKPRVEAEQKFNDRLSCYLTLNHRKGHLRLGGRPTYEEGVTFGFHQEDAQMLLRHALKRNLDPSIFLGHCETTRKLLEHHWGDECLKNNTRESLFGEYAKEKLPTLREIETQYLEGIKTFFPYFITHRGDPTPAIEKAKPYFEKAKQLWEQQNDPRLIKPFIRATSAFFDFLMTDEVRVFIPPTANKFRYEEYSFKEK